MDAGNEIATARAGFELTAASWLARKLEVRREEGARLKPDADATACARQNVANRSEQNQERPLARNK